MIIEKQEEMVSIGRGMGKEQEERQIKKPKNNEKTRKTLKLA